MGKTKIKITSGYLLVTDPQFVRKDLKRETKYIIGQNQFPSGSVISGLPPGEYEVRVTHEGETFKIELTPVSG